MATSRCSGNILVVGNWPTEGRRGNCLLLPISGYAYGDRYCHRKLM